MMPTPRFCKTLPSGPLKSRSRASPRFCRSLHCRLGWFVAAFLLILLTLSCADYAFYPFGTPPPGQSGDRGENGLWLRDSWYFGKYTQNEAHDLAERLKKNRICWAYAHVRFIQKDGRLHFRYPGNARRFANDLRRETPGVRVLAWVYVGNARGMTGVDISDPSVRRVMVAEARWLVTDCGFDGVQWDYEICPDGDPNLLALLGETRAALPRAKTLSISTPLWAPSLPCRFGYGWSDAYFARIAANCDQIVAMGYDSGLALPTLYAGLMAEQVTHVVRSAANSANPDCRVLIGIPTYAKGGLSHNARAESLDVALRGVRAGYGKLSPTERKSFAGVALFADYTTRADEWNDYQRVWLGGAPQSNRPAW